MLITNVGSPRFSLILKSTFLVTLFFASIASAQPNYSPNHVFSALEYSNTVVDRLLEVDNIRNIETPESKELSVKPMHVYELHISTLKELYLYAIKNNRRPPPLPVSTPIKYTPTDVYYLTQLIMDTLESIYKDKVGVTVIGYSMNTYNDRSPTQVYQEIFELYYKLNRLNGREKISPGEVYAQIRRAREDLQSSLLIQSKRLEETQEARKRLLITAIYGMHPDGTIMPQMQQGKSPADVLSRILEVRSQLNAIRKVNKLSEIPIPARDSYGTIKPIDVFLQTQFVIAELNLLKMPMNITSITNSAKQLDGKTPSDVYQEAEHISYMLDRLLNSL